jgi:SAM-dependent methyltransferase
MYCPNCAARTSSTWAAGPPTSGHGSCGPAVVPSASTTQPSNSRPPKPSNRRSVWSSLIHGNAETVPLPDNSFDIAISEYGASSWCDPALWIPEAVRLLRAGGQLIFLRNSTLVELCTAPGADVVGDRLTRPYANSARIDRPDGGTHFQLPTGPMIRLLRESGFLIDELTEFVVPADAHSDYEYLTPNPRSGLGC